MKLCVADYLGQYVDSVFNNLTNHNGTSMLMASLFYTLQIYSDFAGYSLIAIGTSLVLGFRLMDNFKRPYFSVSITDFWRRWHISLSLWLKDYIYISLGGNRVSKVRNYANILLTFLVSGIWHGANWTFILWGILHGIAQVIEKMVGIKKREDKGIVKAIHIVCTFIIINFAWILFRSPDVSTSFYIFKEIFMHPGVPFIDKQTIAFGSISFLILLLKDVKDEYYPQSKRMNLCTLHSPIRPIRFAVFICLIAYILNFGCLNNSSFIYFQF